MNRGPDVAVALIESKTQPEHFLVQRRALDNKQYPGWLEFPGGKVENNGEFNGESPAEALRRETEEEVGLEITQCKFLVATDYLFPSGLLHKVHFFVVSSYIGEPEGLEDQPLAWLTLYQIMTYHRMLPLNRAAALILTTERHPDILE
jgi:8-oxo-dGTP diphosphatase